MATANDNPAKIKKGFFQALSEKCSSLAGLLVFLMIFLNLAVVYSFEKSRKPQIVYTVERVFVNTNVNSSAVVATVPARDPVPSSSASDASGSNVVSVVSDPNAGLVRLSTPYDFFTYDFRRFCRMFDRMFAEGSLTSFGRIVVIFPDRILLEDGSYINNSKWSGSQPSPVVAASTLKRNE